MNRAIISCAPGALSESEIQACVGLITLGRAVDPESAGRGFRNAVLVAIMREAQNIVAVGAIKQKRPHYVRKIIESSGFSFDENLHELGYICVDPGWRGRGLAFGITTKLMAEFPVRPIFATTSHDRMKTILKGAGFLPQGKPWDGDSGLLSLLIAAVPAAEG